MSNTEKQEPRKAPLTDEEAKEVAGGIYDDAPDKKTWFRWAALGEGREVLLACYDRGIIFRDYRNARCSKCGETEGSLYCRILSTHPVTEGFECIDAKCYNCGYHYGNCEMQAGLAQVYVQNWGR